MVAKAAARLESVMGITDQYPDLRDEQYIEQYSFDDCYTYLNPDKPASMLDVSAALILTNGHLSNTARLLNRSRSYIKRFIGSNLELTDLYQELYEQNLDDIEQLQMHAAKSGDSQAQRFLLTTLGKDRGYVTKQEVETKDPRKIPSSLPMDRLSDSALEEIMKVRDAGQSAA